MVEEIPEQQLDFLDPRIPRVRDMRVTYPGTSITFRSRNGITFVEDDPNVVILDNGKVDFNHCEDTVRNPSYYLVFADRPIDDGGHLTIVKSAYRRNAASIHSPWLFNQRCEGALCVLTTPFLHEGVEIWSTQVGFPSDKEVGQDGTKAWKLSRPAQPLWSLAVFIAELKDLPRLLYLKLRGLSTIGDWYLASTFGWEALFRDIVGMYKTYLRISTELEFLIRNNGKQVRRTFSFPLQSTYDVLDDNQGVVGISLNTAPKFGLPSIWASQGFWKLSYEKQWRTWFSGNFIYYLKDGGIPFKDTPEERNRLRALLTGAKVTPNVVWEALPWSWLVDYFFNIGDILANLSAEVADRQLTSHAYTMRETTRKYTAEGSDGYYFASANRTIRTLVRRKTDPYGLELDQGLSQKQTLILAALGLSRV